MQEEERRSGLRLAPLIRAMRPNGVANDELLWSRRCGPGGMTLTCSSSGGGQATQTRSGGASLPRAGGTFLPSCSGSPLGRWRLPPSLPSPAVPGAGGVSLPPCYDSPLGRQRLPPSLLRQSLGSAVPPSSLLCQSLGARANGTSLPRCTSDKAPSNQVEE